MSKRSLRALTIPAAVAATVAIAPAAGCVLSPTDQGSVDSRYSPVTLSGYASAPSNDLELRSWNYQRGTWELVRAFRSGTSAIGRDRRIYAWSTTVPLIGNRYWVPPGASCSTGGMGRFEVRERQHEGWLVLKTFDASGLECLGDELADGTDAAAAGLACYTGENVRLFAPDACVTAPASDSTPPSVVLRATDDVRTWEVRPGDLVIVDPVTVSGQALRLRADGLDQHGLTTVQIDFEAEIVCRASDGSTAWRRSYNRVYEPATPPVIAAGTRVAASFGAATDLTADSFRSLCPAGTWLRSATIHATAAAFNRNDTPAVSPTLSFTMYF